MYLPCGGERFSESDIEIFQMYGIDGTGPVPSL